MCMKSRIDCTDFKIRLKFINNKSKSQTYTKGVPKSIPRYVFKAYTGDSIYMGGKKFLKSKIEIFHIHSTYWAGGSVLSLKSDICSCNILIFCTVKISILSRWKAIISNNCSVEM
jgi:hypothetical protein